MVAKTATNGKVSRAEATRLSAPRVETVQLSRPRIERMEIKVIGISPLIMHKWSDKAIKMIEDKQQKKAAKAREAKDPEAEYLASIHLDADGNPAFPSIGFKAAVVTAVSQTDAFTKVFMRGAFHVEGTYVKIIGEHHMRTDMVRIGMGTADVRYRAEFPEWEATIPIVYNAGAISKEQLISMFELAGFACGIGEWRPEKDGSFGMFRVGTEDD